MIIFISATTSEFKKCRDAIASDLRATGAVARVQDDFTTGSGTLLEKLEAYVAGCDRVIVIVGDAFGAEPKDSETRSGSPRRSYTQWEYFFAIGERIDGSHADPKRVYTYLPANEYLTPNLVKEPIELREAQSSFIRHIRESSKDRTKFSSFN